MRLREVVPTRPSCGDFPSEVEGVGFDDGTVKARVPLCSMRVRKSASLLEVEAIVSANEFGTALMSNPESTEVGVCVNESPKSDATWLLNAGYGGIYTGCLFTNS